MTIKKFTFTKVYETNLKENASIVGWTEDNKKCYIVTNKGDRNLTSLCLFDLENLEETLIESDPEKLSDIGLY